MFRFKSYSIWMFTFIIVIQAGSSMINLGVTPLLPFIKDDLNLNIVQIGYLAAAVQMGNALSSIPSGLLVDTIGVKKMLFFGGTFLGITSMSFYFLDLYIFILISLFFTGFFYSSLSPALSKGVIELFPAKIRGTMMGVKQTIISVSAFIAALWLPYIATTNGWRTGYLIIGFIFILSSFTALFYKSAPNNNVDRDRSSSNFKNVIYIFKNDSLRTVCFIIPFFFMAQFIPTAFLMVDVNKRYGIPLIQAGYLLALLQLGSIIGRLFFGMLGDWIFLTKRELLLSLIASLSAVFFIIFALIEINSFLILGILVFFIGCTSAGWNSIYLVFVSESTEMKFVGLASGMTLTVGYLGSTIAIPFFGYLAEVFGGFIIPWIILAVFMLFTSYMFYRLSGRLMKS